MNEEDMAKDPQVRLLIYASLSRLVGFWTDELCDIEVHGSSLNIFPSRTLNRPTKERLGKALSKLGAVHRSEGYWTWWTLPMI